MTTIGEKADHVRNARQTRLHVCHWPGCGATVPPAIFMCRPHWYALPKALRNRIWATYRRGQEQDMRPSAEYIEVAREVQDWIAAREGRAG